MITFNPMLNETELIGNKIGYLRPRKIKLADILLVLISSGVAAYAIYELVRTSF